MIVKSIKLLNFRNYENCEISLSPKINVFVGENAQGKTNLLESLFFVSTTKSHRALEDIDMIKENTDTARSTVRLDENEVETELTVMISKEGKYCFVQKQPVKKISDFVGKLNTIIFSPTDFELFDGSPKNRRKFIDMEIGKVVSGYVQLLNNYQKILKERNNSLKNEEIDDAYIEVLTERIASLSLKISRCRRQFISVINRYLVENYQNISGEKLPIKVRYYSFIDEEDDEKAVRNKYKKVYDRDKFLKQTNIGVHKDDISFWINDKDANSYASQGQKRMIILALKTALIGYIRQTSRRDAVLLLDDVLSELDETRQRNLINLIPEGIQTIITTTSIKDISNNLPSGTYIYKISEGNINSFREV